MIDPLTIARDRLAKAETKLEKLEKQVESARSEVADLRTTVRVMTEITGESTPEKADPPPARQKEILSMLPQGEAKAVAPLALFDTYKLMGRDDISLDVFRTTLWRMKGNLYVLPKEGNWVVRGDAGKYWKEAFRDTKEASGDEPEASDYDFTGLATGRGTGFPSSPPGGSIPPSSTRVQPASFDTDLDDDVPF